MLTADNEGVTLLGEGIVTDGPSFTLTDPEPRPGSGGRASQARVQRGPSRPAPRRPPLPGDDRALAWHRGRRLAGARSRDRSSSASRTVLDATLADGHALWVADVDGDGDDEVFAGHRGKDHRVSMYDFDRSSGKWNRTVLDRDIAAQDLRGGDLDGDGTPDVVAVGGATHNVVWYRPQRP